MYFVSLRQVSIDLWQADSHGEIEGRKRNPLLQSDLTIEAPNLIIELSNDTWMPHRDSVIYNNTSGFKYFIAQLSNRFAQGRKYHCNALCKISDGLGYVQTCYCVIWVSDEIWYGIPYYTKTQRPSILTLP